MLIESVWKEVKRVVRMGGPIARIGCCACLPRSYGHITARMGAKGVKGERTHHTRPAGAKKPT